ncbi:MAG: pyridoxal 5'-phosphate synthase glutaminase subunit PdxT [Candidatus Bipolaricaulota bacterium]
MKLGILALQGDFREHKSVIQNLGASTVLVKRPDHLGGLDGLVIPGGESTAIAKLMEKWGLFELIKEKVAGGLPVFGTCAGLILMAKDLEDGPPTLGLMDIEVERNAYGRQIESFEGELETTEKEEFRGNSVHGVFIRAPQVKRVGPEVKVLAEHEQLPVLLREDRLLAATFHPELTDDPGVHDYFLRRVVRGS